MSREMHPCDAEDACNAYNAEQKKEREQLAIDWIVKHVAGNLKDAYAAHLRQFEHPMAQTPKSFAEDMRDGGDPLWALAMDATE